MTETTTHMPERSPAEYADEIGQVWTRIMQRQFGAHQTVQYKKYDPMHCGETYQYSAVPEIIGRYVWESDADDSVLKPDNDVIIRQTTKFQRMQNFLGKPDLGDDGLALELGCPEEHYEETDTDQAHNQEIRTRNIYLFARANQENLDRLMALERHFVARDAQIARQKAHRGAPSTEGISR